MHPNKSQKHHVYRKNTKNFGVFFPDDRIDVGKRYFFFSSLTDDIYDQVYNVINQGMIDNFTNKTNNDGETIMKQAMNFLKQTIDYERNQEYKYFSEHILNNEEFSPTLQEQFLTCFIFSEGKIENVDYIKLIKIINAFYTGLEQFQSDLKYESDRLKLIKEYMDQYDKLSKTEQIRLKKEVKQKDNNSKEDYDLYLASFRQYLINQIKEEKDTKQKQILEQVLGSKSKLNELQDYLYSIYDAIWNSPTIKEKIRNAIANDENDQTVEQTTVAFIASEMARLASDGLLEKLNSNYEITGKNGKIRNATKPEKIKEWANNFFNEIEVEGEEKYFPKQKKEVLDKILKEAKDLQQYDDTQMKILKSRFFSGIDPESIIAHTKGEEGRKRNTIEGITGKLIEQYQDVIDAELKKQKKTVTKREKESKRTYFLRKITQLITDKQLSTTVEYHSNMDYQKIATKLKQIINNSPIVDFNIRKKDNLMSEFSGQRGILSTLHSSNGLPKKVSALTFGSQKSDSSILELGDLIISSKDVSHIFKNIAQQLSDDFQKSLKINNFSLDFDEKKLRFEKGFQDDEFFLEGETLRRNNILNKSIDDTINTLKENGVDTATIKEAISAIKNSFQISTTVKNYNKYDNKIGFHGGSLGGSLEHQLDNLMFMFDIGGITEPDMNWLLFAIYNSGPNLVGSKFKTQLEDYFSTIAVMLMFDDAGQQAQYITQQAEENFSEKASINTLHLYYLNGIYFPSSFILQLTYNGLLHAIGQTDIFINDIQSNGSRANIINTVSNKDIVGGKRNKKGQIKTQSQQNWIDTFNTNKGRVKIQVTFLAGLLDIMEKLEQEMTQIQT